ncbi:MAG TPA: hypothetical protein VNW25_01955 [Candidatus Sulfotelmatobacter sp.]|jgi:hypothetical protein|nr:hypothetical protein [Candidatus Sulfotelmatobacter sp.]
MKLPADKRVILGWILILVAAASAFNLVVVARNYELAYLSLNQLEFTVSKVTLQNPSSSMANIIVEISANNHVDFGGLTAAQALVSVYFSAPGSALFQDRPLQGYSLVDKPLASQGFTALNVILMLTPANATSLLAFSNAHPGRVIASTSVTVIVSSLLSSLFNEINLTTGIGTQFQQLQNVTLT